MRYADDTVILADSAEKLQGLMDVVSRASEEKGLSINIAKSVTMVFSKTEQPPRCSTMINGQELKQVSSFNYLGSLLTSDSHSEQEIKRRIGIGKTAFQNLRRVITNRKLSIATRKRFLKTLWSTMTYGAET
ncbi:uncharacterized protein [Diadema antillarum]|uniref:uncharacterized protein n=1 Tax=Diadema antillarum TaxID=105358 RepID=UPI003A850172